LSAALAKPDLSQVTLVAVTSVALVPTVEALQASIQQANFGHVLLLSDKPPPADAAEGISWRRIRRLGSRQDYSRFMLKDLARHVTTTHALCIQWDGFVLDGRKWDPEFLDYDYIGAPWPHFGDGRNVGNGGFSLRSARLLRACENLPFGGTDAEDVLICRVCRDRLEVGGIRFAPEAVARRFAFERFASSGDEFGFHGAYNLVRFLAPDDAVRIFRSLEPNLLARNERLELFWWALRHARIRLAAEMLLRLI
jgi:hypothetical protein